MKNTHTGFTGQGAATWAGAQGRPGERQSPPKEKVGGEVCGNPGGRRAPAFGVRAPHGAGWVTGVADRLSAGKGPGRRGAHRRKQTGSADGPRSDCNQERTRIAGLGEVSRRHGDSPRERRAGAGISTSAATPLQAELCWSAKRE